MAYVIAEPCIGTKDNSCVEVCPVDCIHPTPDEPDYDSVEMLYIDPEECIDFDACVEACPVDACFAEIAPGRVAELHQAQLGLLRRKVSPSRPWGRPPRVRPSGLRCVQARGSDDDALRHRVALVGLSVTGSRSSKSISSVP